MEERDRETFKHQFIKLTLLLNAIVLFIAIGAFVLLVYHSPLGIGVGLALLVAGVVVFLHTWRLYQETKEWLEVHADSADKAGPAEKP